MLTVDRVAEVLEVNADTVRRRIRDEVNPLPAEAHLGSPRLGYIIRGDQLVDWLRRNGLAIQADVVAERIAAMPESPQHLSSARRRRKVVPEQE